MFTQHGAEKDITAGGKKGNLDFLRVKSQHKMTPDAGTPKVKA